MVCLRPEVRVIQAIKEIIECRSTSLVVSATSHASIFSPSFLTSQLGLLIASLNRIESPLSLPLTMTYSGRGWGGGGGANNVEGSNRIAKEEVDHVPSGTKQHIEFPEVPVVTEAVKFKNLPRKAARPRTSAAKCRELLGQIRNLTYIVEGLENCIILEEVIEKLETCHHLYTGPPRKKLASFLKLQ